MLTFEFIQPGEFDDPFYNIIDEYNEILGEITFDEGFWTLYHLFYDYCLTSDNLDQISTKLKQLNGVN